VVLGLEFGVFLALFRLFLSTLLGTFCVDMAPPSTNLRSRTGSRPETAAENPAGPPNTPKNPPPNNRRDCESNDRGEAAAVKKKQFSSKSYQFKKFPTSLFSVIVQKVPNGRLSHRRRFSRSEIKTHYAGSVNFASGEGGVDRTKDAGDS